MKVEEHYIVLFYMPFLSSNNDCTWIGNQLKNCSLQQVASRLEKLAAISSSHFSDSSLDIAIVIKLELVSKTFYIETCISHHSPKPGIQQKISEELR